LLTNARMVKSADTADLKSADPYQVVGVQVPLRAPKIQTVTNKLNSWSTVSVLMGARTSFKTHRPSPENRKDDQRG
jgi:hypothetical protein